MAKSPRIQLVVDGKDNTKNAFGSISKSLDALEQKTASVGRAMVGAFAGIISVSTLKNIGAINSEWVDMSSRLRRVTKDEAEFASVTERLGEVAESTWSGLNETIESFLSMRGPLADMGYTTEEQVNFVSALNNALVVSGAKKEVAASVQMALNKAMATGVLRGENLNTVIEKGGRIAELLASNLGVTVSELRDMGAQGKITGEVMYSALAGNMQLLSDEAEKMPATVEDAMQRVDESLKGAFRDDELMAPLTDSLLELAEVLKDPSVRQGLANLAAGLAGAATVAVEATSEFGDLGVRMGYSAALIAGNVTAMDQLEAQIKDVDKAINGSFMTKPIKYLFTDEKDLLLVRKSLETRKSHIINSMTGTTAGMRAEEEKRQAMLKEEKSKEAAIQRKYVSDIKEYNRQAVKAVVDRGKEMAKAEKEAAKKVADAKKEIAAIEKQFDDIRKEMAGGGDKEPSFAEYQSLAAAASRAMSSGDTAKAKEDAIAAANVLKELAAAGENTYGFAGMVNSMEALAKSAAAIEQASAEAELIAIQQEITLLAEKAKELENMPVSVEMDAESLDSVKSQISSLLEQLKAEAVIPIRVAAGAAPSTDSAPGFAEGGWTGPGSKYKFGGIVHADEHVQPKRIVREPGALQFLEEIRRNGFRNTVNRIKGYAEGGLVGSSYNAPNISQDLLERPQQKNIGSLNFHLPSGDKFSVDVAGTSNLDDLHRAALKYGRTRK
ncbi:tape measure protein [Denitrificimonas caeni]|uniref:tape measure protein n=1 Tax=Denitrificimonas caeni TaxID=521720 RepID=UPI00196557F1|nr:tape measure protein [Denitrificimonas caeni]